MSAARLERAEVTIRSRQGGERLQTHARGPRRTVKNLLQEAGIPPWQRERVPFIYCGDALAAVPGVAIDVSFAATGGEPSIRPSWRDAASVRRP
jgi:tRNA(Ile)-lysidine synthase